MLFLDIESSPDVAYVFGNKWEPTVVEYREYSHVLGFSAIFQGEHITKALPDYKNFKNDIQSDKNIVREIRDLLDKADLVIGWNSDKFDLRYLTTRFLKWHLDPPSPFKSIDLIKTSRSRLKLPSNSLDDFTNYFGLARKLDHEKRLFIQCTEGDKHAFDLLKEYNANDTKITKDAYYFLLPYIKSHPNISTFKQESGCPRCGNHVLIKKGFCFTATGRYQRYVCPACKAWSQGIVNLAEIRPFKNI